MRRRRHHIVARHQQEEIIVDAQLRSKLGDVLQCRATRWCEMSSSAAAKYVGAHIRSLNIMQACSEQRPLLSPTWLMAPWRTKHS